MNNVLLTVWDKGGKAVVLDLYGQDTISLNFNFNSITSLKPGDIYSQEFRIPATQTNCDLFGLQSDFNIASYNGLANNIKKKFKAIITVDTVPISEGFVQFKSSFVKSGKMSDFAITFYGEQVDLGVVLKDKDFTVLNYDDAVHYFSLNECRTVNNGGITNGNDYSDHRLMWTMIDKGEQFMIYPSDLQGTFVNAPYSYGTYIQPDNMLSVDMLTPCVKGAYLINKINEYIIGQNGRPISLSATIQAEVDKMCLAFVSKDGKIRYENELASTIQFKANQTTDEILSFSSIGSGLYRATCTTTFNEVIDIGSNFDTSTGLFTVPTDGYYQFSFRGTLRAEVGGVLTYPSKTVVPGFLVNGTTFISGWANNTTGTINSGGPTLPNGTSDYPIESSLDAIFFLNSDPDQAIGFQAYSKAPVTSQNGLLTVTSFNNIAAANPSTCRHFNQYDVIRPAFLSIGDPSAGGTIDIITNVEYFQFEKVQIQPNSLFSLAKMAPEKYQLLDFIQDIMKLTNAVAIPNYTNYGVVDIMTMDEYLAGGGTIDWTPKLDESAEISILPSSEYQTRKQKFTFSEGADVASQAYKSVGRVYGSLELYDTDSDFTVGENIIEVKASTTPNQPLNGSADWYMPKFIDSEYKFVYPNARIFYYNFDYKFNIIPDGGNPVPGVDGMWVPYIGHYDVPLPDLSSNDLNFAQEIPLHPIISAPINTSYLKYYNNYLQELYSSESKVITAQFNLDVTDILNLNFNDSVFLFNSYWRVLSVQGYNMGMNKSTAVTLIKKLQGVDIPAVCTDTAIAIEKDGSVQWLNGGSQVCCEQIGYYWNDALSTCYKSQNQGGLKPPSTSPLSTVNGGFANLFNGQTLVKDPGATGTIVVGKNLTVTGEAKNSIVGGEELLVQNKGMWYGGGSDGVLKNRAATGTMVWHAKEVFTSSSMIAIVGQFLTLTNAFYSVDVQLTCMTVNVTMSGLEPALGYSIKTYSYIVNINGVASGENPHNIIIDVDNGLGVFELGWTVDPTNSQIINLEVKNTGAASYPTPEIYMTAQVIISQIGTE